MTPFASILPPNATAFERAMEASAGTPIEGVPVPLRAVWDPDACPVGLLPWLAWALDVPAWDPAWPEALKRGICRDSWELHRRQGTLGGLKALARWAGARIVRAVTPPAKHFAGKSLTQAERNAFVARYPQLRIYRYRTRGARVGAMCHRDYAGHAFPVQSDAALRIAPRAYLYRDGAETALEIEERREVLATREAVTTTEVHQHSTRASGAFAPGHPRQTVASSARSRLYTLRLSQPYVDSREDLRKITVQPGLDPIDIHYDQVAEQGQRRGWLLGHLYLRGSMPATTAPDRLYQRLYLFDPEVAPILRRACSFMAGTLGMRPHKAELLLEVRGRLKARQALRYLRGCLPPHDGAPLEAARLAIAWGKRLSDKILLDTVTRRPALAGPVAQAGTLRAGAHLAS